MCVRTQNGKISCWSVFGLNLEYLGGLWLVVLYYHIIYTQYTFPYHFYYPPC